MQSLLRRLAPPMLSAALGAPLGCSSPEPLPELTCVVPVGSSPERGPLDAWVTIVEFTDFECAYCGSAEATIAHVDAARPGLRWVFKHFPLTMLHTHALDASLAAECANEQGMFWEMHRLLFDNQGRLDAESLTNYAESLGLDAQAYGDCLASSDAYARIDADFTLGLKIGVRGTPAFFINGRMLPGAYPAEDFVEVIDEARSEAKRSGIAQAEYYERIEFNGCDGS